MQSKTPGISFFIALLALSFTLTAQPYKNPKYGADSASRMQCAMDLSTLNEFMKIDLYSYAIDAFQRVFKECPAASKNIYVYGIRIYKNLIENEKDEASRQRKIDSLMLIYDKRIEYFGEEGVYLGRKGLDLLRYSNRIEEAYSYLKKSTTLLKDKTEDAVLIGLMQCSANMYGAKQISQSDYLQDYAFLLQMLDIRKQSGTEADKTEKLSQGITKLVLSGGNVDCNALKDLFSPVYPEHMQDTSWLEKTLAILEAFNCNEQVIYMQCAEQLYTLRPDAASALQIANMYYKKQDDIKSEEYFDKAVKLETDPVKKAKDYYMLGLVKSRSGKELKEVRDCALEALKLNPTWGDPYILIGNAYVLSSKNCGSNEFEQKAVFWAAVDQFRKARAVDPSLKETASSLIAQYSAYFPSKENAFFYGYTEGNNYTVGCWINEVTKVRFKED